ncbi:hypothetical protein IHE45_07G099700 [Dioscorea alata]|uniref:Uncharacterized protein n=1 Tax=Dioscorea alata TaxID=55571 RepID=A0ACB7VTB3_DIOAL|nr:hypothetical protein IHE45_07G099700 [Dioscorea alata]
MCVCSNLESELVFPGSGGRSLSKGESPEMPDENKKRKISPDPDSSLRLGHNEGNDAAISEQNKKVRTDIEHNSSLPAGSGVVARSSTIGEKPLCPCKKLGQVVPVDDSGCSSTAPPVEESESLKIWKEMKRNGFLSSPHGGVPLTKNRGQQCTKKKHDEQKKKPKRIKKEKENMFIKFAAPSGLLSGCNPGIIKCVKNSKQVHSKIEAMLRLVHYCSQVKSGCSDLLEVGIMGGNNEIEEQKTAHYGTANQFSPSLSNLVCDDTLKSSLNVTTNSEKSISASNDESSANAKTVYLLSLKGASVASLWLELLQFDINCRLAALDLSKRRFRNVMKVELPNLLSVEFSSNQRSKPCSEHPSVVDKHEKRWRALYGQMRTALKEEEKHLESLSIQVQNMRVLCDKGLKYGTADGRPIFGSSEDPRLELRRNFLLLLQIEKT